MFSGHLIERVAGIDISPANPAELVQAAYGRWGTGCFGRLNGNFSIAIYDPDLPGFIIARDIAGTRPVFYSFANIFVFGSSAGEVLRATALPVIANARALSRYLMNGAVAGRQDTLFEGVKELPGAHYLKFVAGCAPSVHAISYKVDVPSARAYASFAQSSNELRRLVLDAVRTQSSGMSIGVPLSGGIDSSGIVGCLRNALGPDEPLHAFCFSHGNAQLPRALDELPWAVMAANHARATLHPVTLQASAIPEAMPRIVTNQEFPFGSPVVIAHAEVFKVAADHGIQVMFSGNGPDVVFSKGVAQYAARALSLLNCGRVSAAWHVLQGGAEYTEMSPFRLLDTSIRYSVRQLWPRRELRVAPPWARRSWFSDRVCLAEEEPAFHDAGVQGEQQILKQLYRSAHATALHFEECNALPNGIELRWPYLLKTLLCFAGTLPLDHVLSDSGVSKYLLRSALAGLVPGEILERKNRVGFAVPVVPWLHELRPWVESRLLDLRLLPFFDETSTIAFWDNLGRNDASAWRSAYVAWRWIVLLEWAIAHDVRFR